MHTAQIVNERMLGLIHVSMTPLTSQRDLEAIWLDGHYLIGSEKSIAARTIQQSSGKAEFRKWMGSWFEKRQRQVARRFYFLRDFLFVKVIAATS